MNQNSSDCVATRIRSIYHCMITCGEHVDNKGALDTIILRPKIQYLIMNCIHLREYGRDREIENSESEARTFLPLLSYLRSTRIAISQ